VKQKEKQMRRGRVKRMWLCACFSFCFFSPAVFLPAQESGAAPVVIPRESWNGFLTDWTALKQSFGELEIQRTRLREQYDLLPPKLVTLEATLRQSEELSTSLRERLEASAARLSELNGLLKQQTGLTESLERKVRIYRGAFFVSLGIGIAGAGTGVLLYILK
jgi:hypothetical protein